MFFSESDYTQCLSKYFSSLQSILPLTDLLFFLPTGLLGYIISGPRRNNAHLLSSPSPLRSSPNSGINGSEAAVPLRLQTSFHSCPRSLLSLYLHTFSLPRTTAPCRQGPVLNSGAWNIREINLERSSAGLAEAWQNPGTPPGIVLFSEGNHSSKFALSLELKLEYPRH